jgi:hypothetical protein
VKSRSSLLIGAFCDGPAACGTELDPAQYGPDPDLPESQQTVPSDADHNAHHPEQAQAQTSAPAGSPQDQMGTMLAPQAGTRGMQRRSAGPSGQRYGSMVPGMPGGIMPGGILGQGGQRSGGRPSAVAQHGTQCPRSPGAILRPSGPRTCLDADGGREAKARTTGGNLPRRPAHRLLALQPLRLRNLAALEIGGTLVKTGNRWIIAIPPTETKTYEPIEVPWSDVLLDPLEHYLAEIRPVLSKQASAAQSDSGRICLMDSTGRVAQRLSALHRLADHPC